MPKTSKTILQDQMSFPGLSIGFIVLIHVVRISIGRNEDTWIFKIEIVDLESSIDERRAFFQAREVKK